ncbi:site-specific DNA-methyltransferase [Eggerthella lenta]|uniref:Site-specific DNA-methyltransferase n=6 Tax=Actinomycetota TaxID=201174 RepID=A0A5C5BPY4_EGGLN|nr:hypothetical protein [Bifidobacterium asteroides]RGJ07420.1 hypothetical protein DXD77_09255 [Collinsella sp. TM09-10AT]RGK39455.1 hypothetical protein DXD16_04215 [Collinsella sp. TF11-5AC]RGQ33950.1 hypothetical protein DWZ01_03235 [Collinsella sp. AF28-5AC]RGR40640.1 hypothetical protein DWY51_04510 [Collinsella sp. AF25-2LB]RGW93586.1 hypothetical protein DWV43_04305 [Collinsella sp. AF05-9]RGW94813.1 hypothetical protein DWV42_03680 [Collinsella sp. AF05-8-2]RHC92775.1 hypothetical p
MHFTKYKFNVYRKKYIRSGRDSAVVGIVGKSKSLDFLKMLIFWSLVRNSVVLAVYLLFSVACFFTVHEHLSTGDIVLDFFSGSASTAHAMFLQELGKDDRYQFILVQLPEPCDPKRDAYKDGYETLCDIGEGRIRRAGDKIKTELEESNRQLKLGEGPKQLPDIGFRVFELDESGIEKPEPGQLLFDVVKPDRSDMDIVFEMMLKWGLELTLPVEKSEAAGYPIWSVACDELVCCMSRGLTIEALEAIADMEPRRVLILDSVLDDTLKLNAVQIFKHAGERMGCEIELRTV